MKPCHRCRSPRLWGILVALAICGCGDHDSSSPPRIAVLSAFPAELAAYVDHATVNETTVINGRVFRSGMLAGVRVVMGLTGIGLVNAATTTRALLERLDVDGIVVSGVANSTLHIGDVTVPAAWAMKDDTTYAVQQDWLALAEDLAMPGTVSLERCTAVPSASENPVCMPQAPVVVVGGVGQSSDSFGSNGFPCQPGGGDLYGCDIDAMDSPSAAAIRHRKTAALASDAAVAVTNDMETAAIAREATLRGIPFIAFRAVSDGAGDPLGLPGSLAQFSAYYHFAARNAAAAMLAFLERIAATTVGKGEGSGSRVVIANRWATPP